MGCLVTAPDSVLPCADPNKKMSSEIIDFAKARKALGELVVMMKKQKRNIPLQSIHVAGLDNHERISPQFPNRENRRAISNSLRRKNK